MSMHVLHTVNLSMHLLSRDCKNMVEVKAVSCVFLAFPAFLPNLLVPVLVSTVPQPLLILKQTQINIKKDLVSDTSSH
jgi:hypothetical protein